MQFIVIFVSSRHLRLIAGSAFSSNESPKSQEKTMDDYQEELLEFSQDIDELNEDATEL
jgi:hypothetical protein